MNAFVYIGMNCISWARLYQKVVHPGLHSSLNAFAGQSSWLALCIPHCTFLVPMQPCIISLGRL